MPRSPRAPRGRHRHHPGSPNARWAASTLGFGRLNFDDADVVGELPDRAAAADPRKARRSYADQVLEMFRSRGLKGYKAITLAKVAYLGEPCCPISGRRGRSDLSRSGVTSPCKVQ